MKKLVFFALLLALCLLTACQQEHPVQTTEPATTALPEEYTVTFQLNGGRLLSGNCVQTVLSGEGAAAPEARYGFRTLSWDCDFSSITADTTVNALWTVQTLSQEELTALAAKTTLSLSVRTLEGKELTGSGFFIGPDGSFITTWQLLEKAASVEITAPDGNVYPLEAITAFSPVYNLAVLKIQLETPDYLDFSMEDSDDQDSVFIAGAEGLTAALVTDVSYSLGVCSCIRLDAEIPQAALGGPLLSNLGEVIGINGYQTVRGEKISLAISAEATEALDEAVSFTLEELQQWYTEEIARSYRPSNNKTAFFDSLVNTYTTVTGRSCFASMSVTGKLLDGYTENCTAYMYSYKPGELADYEDYLTQQGFVVLETGALEDGQVQTTYICDVTNITITCMLDEASGYLAVIPATI